MGGPIEIHRPRARLKALALATVALAAASFAMVEPARSASITILNKDGAGEGLNDATPVAPVGGNGGTTRGQQRFNVLREAARIWGGILPDAIEIKVDAYFDSDLPCDATGAVLGRTGAIAFVSNFPNAPVQNTWYHIALARKLAGQRLNGQGVDYDDMETHFNSSLDNGCFSGIAWYYGLDHAHGNNLDLLSVAIHELAHGLGFSSFEDLSTGAFYNGQSDIFSRFIFDTSVNLHWYEMTDQQRLASQVNTGHLVWDGGAVTTQAPNYLGHRGIVRVNSPGSPHELSFGTASFGASLSSPGVTADVVLAVDGTTPTSDACSGLVNASQMSGKIALVDRGNCAFVVKAEQVQAAGAVGMVVVNTSDPAIDLAGVDPTVTIPVVCISQSDGNTIKSQLGGGVNLTLTADASHLAGANDQGKVLLYAPNPAQPGSSVSHWDVSATPDLLLEPFATPDLTSDVDLTRFAFADIGWAPNAPGHDVGGGGGGDGLPDPHVSFGLAGPNPFRRSQSSSEFAFSFSIDRSSSDVSVDIYDLNGRKVRELYHGAADAGVPMSIAWNGYDDHNRRLPAGLYVYRVKAEGGAKSRSLLLIP